MATKQGISIFNDKLSVQLNADVFDKATDNTVSIKTGEGIKLSSNDGLVLDTTVVTKIAATEVAKIVDNADTAYDTLREIAEYISGDITGAANMQNAINANAEAITHKQDTLTFGSGIAQNNNTIWVDGSQLTVKSATDAINATNDANGQSITATYAKKTEVEGVYGAIEGINNTVKSHTTSIENLTNNKQDNLEFGNGLKTVGNLVQVDTTVLQDIVDNKKNIGTLSDTVGTLEPTVGELQITVNALSANMGDKQDTLTFGSGLTYETSTKQLAVSDTLMTQVTTNKSDIKGLKDSVNNHKTRIEALESSNQKTLTPENGVYIDASNKIGVKHDDTLKVSDSGFIGVHIGTGLETSDSSSAIVVKMGDGITNDSDLAITVNHDDTLTTTSDGKLGVNETAITNIAAAKVAEIVAGAPDKYDTLKEIADYIKGDEANAATMSNDIAEVKGWGNHGTAGYAKKVKVGDTTYEADPSAVVTLPAYPTSLPADGGNAATADKIRSSGVLTTDEAIDAFIEGNKVKYATFKIPSNALGFQGNDGLILSIPWGSATDGVQMAFDDAIPTTIKVRGMSSKVWGDWQQIAYTDSTVAAANSIELTYTTNLNEVTSGTFFRSTDNPENMPPGSNIYLTGFTVASNGDERYRLMLGLDNNGKTFTRCEKAGTWQEWKQLATTDSTVASADKLATPRKIWGRDFDGSGDVFGMLRLYNKNSYNSTLLGDTSGLTIESWQEGIGYLPIKIQPNGGNVGIGTTEPKYPLDVKGHIKTDSSVLFDEYLWSKSHYLYVRDDDKANWVVTNKNWTMEYNLLHTGNLSTYFTDGFEHINNNIVRISTSYITEKIKGDGLVLDDYGKMNVDSSKVVTVSGRQSISGKDFTESIVITGASDAKIVLNNTDNDSKYQFISFRQNGTQYGAFGTYGDDELRWNSNLILHKGNYATTLDRVYLKQSGGLLAGELQVNGRVEVMNGQALEWTDKETEGSTSCLLLPRRTDDYRLQYYNGTKWEWMAYTDDIPTFGEGFENQSGTLKVSTSYIGENMKGDGLALGENGRLSVNVGEGFQISDNVVQLKLSTGLAIDSQGYLYVVPSDLANTE